MASGRDISCSSSHEHLIFPAELVIALLEAFIYRAALRGRSKRRAFLCGLCANVCSAALGFFLAEPVWQFVVSIS